MDIAEKYQRQLLDQVRAMHRDTPLSEATEAAYLARPRHAFVRKYREWGTRTWHAVTPENLQEHLGTVYANRPLILFGEDDDNVPSTISQPALVLRMLDLLQLRPGHRVFELGVGSGWNAALIAHIVGDAGHVYGTEIIPELADAAAQAIEQQQIRNVSVIAADGGDGYAAGAPYDRAVFTAGAYDLPRCFYDQLADGGLLLIVIKNPGGGDHLFLLRKNGDHFESLESLICGFVQLTGKHQVDHLEPTAVESLPGWDELRHRQSASRPFWWGGKGKMMFAWQTLGIRSFLAITEPTFRAFKAVNGAGGGGAGGVGRSPAEELYFGLWDAEAKSLVLARDDRLVTYGSPDSHDRLLQRVRQWADLGMPGAASFTLRVYPSNRAVSVPANHWLVRRAESQFLWSLEG